MADISELSRIAGVAGAGVQLPIFPDAPLPQSILKICPELADWQRQNAELRSEWLRKMTFNLNQP